MTDVPTAVYETTLPGLRARGKVRDIYDLGESLMIVASDRISAFDVVMGEPVPGKGELLTQMSRFWLDTLPACSPHHLEYVVDDGHCPRGYEANLPQLRRRAMVVRKAEVVPVECVVRGYIVGGGWKEYQQVGSVSGVKLPPGLKLADRLPTPIFTPSTKAVVGHDEPISIEQAAESLAPRLGSDATRLMYALRDRSLAIYQQAAEFAAQRGIIIADTKFEFGLPRGDARHEPILIDEVLTPDSSRFWPADQWRPGANPPSFDKQYLRDYLESISWNKTPPPPPIPAEVIEQTRRRYADAYRLLTGRTAAGR